MKGRRSIRLQGYDYSLAGAYFVTICTQDSADMFGEIADGKMLLNDAGHMIESWWIELNTKFPNVETDEYMVMPNHFHGIIVITIGGANVGADLCVCPNNTGAHVGADLRVCPNNTGAHVGADLRVCPNNTGAHDIRGAHAGAPLHGIVQWFKTMTTNEYIRGAKTLGWPRFRGRLWQRNYYEHIIRNNKSLNNIRNYICDNPIKWKIDRNHTAGMEQGLLPQWEPPHS